MTQEITLPATYEQVQEHLRPWLAQTLRELIDTINAQATASGYLAAQQGMVLVQAARELGKLYRVQEIPGGDLVPIDEVNRRIDRAVQAALEREVPAAVEAARQLWEQEKQILEAGMRTRALERVRAAQQ